MGAAAYGHLASQQAGFDPADFGLGRNTFTADAHLDGRRVSGQPRDIDALLTTSRSGRAAGRPLALWIGASQLHAINRMEQGDQLAVYYASQAARRRSSKVAYVQLSSPNANLCDLLGYYLAFRRSGLTPSGAQCRREL